MTKARPLVVQRVTLTSLCDQIGRMENAAQASICQYDLPRPLSLHPLLFPPILSKALCGRREACLGADLEAFICETRRQLARGVIHVSVINVSTELVTEKTHPGARQLAVAAKSFNAFPNHRAQSSSPVSILLSTILV